MKKLDPEKVAPFRFDRGSTGALLLHGFTGSPFVMRKLGEYLAERDVTVLCRALPGHGVTPSEMAKTNWYDWYQASREYLAELAANCEKVFLCGLSMGGTLSLHLAAHYANRYKVAGVAAYGAPVYMRNILFPFLPIAGRLISFKRIPEPDVADPVARAEVEGYDHVPLNCVSSLLELISHVKHDLQEIKVPVLLVQSKNDHTVHPPNVHLIASLLGTSDKTVIEVEKSFHVLTVDYDRELLQEETYKFVQRVSDSD